jgi:hypothetical protein
MGFLIGDEKENEPTIVERLKDGHEEKNDSILIMLPSHFFFNRMSL